MSVGIVIFDALSTLATFGRLRILSIGSKLRDGEISLISLVTRGGRRLLLEHTLPQTCVLDAF